MVWSNIIVQIEGTNTDWCSVDNFIVQPSDRVTLSNVGVPKVYPAITRVICLFPNVTFTDYERRQREVVYGGWGEGRRKERWIGYTSAGDLRIGYRLCRLSAWTRFPFYCSHHIHKEW